MIKIFSGTFFIHAIFFAHEPEPNLTTTVRSLGRRIFLTGTRHEEYIPEKPIQTWIRNPKG